MSEERFNLLRQSLESGVYDQVTIIADLLRAESDEMRKRVDELMETYASVLPSPDSR